MPITFVQSKSAAAASATPSVTFTGAPAADSLVVALLVATTLSGALTARPGTLIDTSTAQPFVVMDLVYFAASAPQTVQWTMAGSNNFEAVAAEFSGASPSPLDQHVISTATTGVSHQPGSLTPNNANELFVAYIGSSSASAGEACDSGFSVIEDATLTIAIFAYKIKTDSAAENPSLSWTTNRQSQAGQACFNPFVPSARPPTLILPSQAAQRASRW